MKKKTEKVEVVEAVEEVKTRGRKKMTSEEKELRKKYKLVEEFKKSLGIDDIVDVGDDGTKQKITDKIKEIKKSLTDLNNMIKKI